MSQAAFRKKRISRIFHVSGKEWFLFFEACATLFLWRIITVWLPLKVYVKLLGEHQQETSQESSLFTDQAKNILRAIQRAKKYALLDVKCFTEAIAAKRMLRRRGIPSTLYLGVTREPDNQTLIAHAWLRCGNRIVTGSRGMEKFTVVSTFG